MGVFTNILELVRSNNYKEIEEESAREVVIAIAGTSADTRDKLFRALSTRMESLWTTSPFRQIESYEETPTEDTDGGLLLYVLGKNDRLPPERKEWLTNLAQNSFVQVIVVVLEKGAGEPFEAKPKNSGLQRINPLRLVGGRETPANGGSADGAGSYNTNSSGNILSWQSELNELQMKGMGRISVMSLPSLDIDVLSRNLLPEIVAKLPGKELALARRAPIFRNAVADFLIAKTARDNAQLALIANATAGIPFISGLFSSGADFVVLTVNQFELSHRLASVYGQKRDTRVEVYLELTPIVVAAFGWKAFSILATKRFPPILALIPKSGIAFAATYIVGFVAKLYYASGRKAPGQVASVVRSVVDLVARRGGSTPNEGGEGDSRNFKTS